MSKFFTSLLIIGNLALGGFILYDRGYLKDIPLPELALPAIPTINKTPDPAPVVIAKASNLNKVTSFAYYTSRVDPGVVAGSKHPMVIVNEANSDSKLFTKEDVRIMKAGGKLVLAELSVGYAENYRWYWESSWNTLKPSYIGPSFATNQFYVKDFSHPEWVSIVQKMIDKAIEAGYDGVVLEGIDVYAELGGAKELRDKMIDFVIGISEYAKKANPNFLIVPKNAEILGHIPVYAAAIDGHLKDELVYTLGTGTIGVKNGNDQIVKSLRDLKASGKPVFVIEYVSGSYWTDAKNRLKSNGFIGYSAPTRTPSTIRENVW